MTVLDKEHRMFLRRLNSDIREAALTMERDEARFLVDLYYQLQHFRKIAKNQSRAGEEPNLLLTWLGGEFQALEGRIKLAMEAFAERWETGRWMLNIYAVGPVIAGGFLAHLDIKKAKSYASMWRFAGLDPTVTWGKGEKRPWNTKLKTLCWKFSDVQMKFANREQSFYGPLYQKYKAKLVERNEAGEFKDAAIEGASRVGKKTEAYKYYVDGKLPPGHIHARALRWLSKLFLAHYFEVAHWEEYGVEAPNPYVFEHMTGHSHKIDPPGWEPK